MTTPSKKRTIRKRPEHKMTAKTAAVKKDLKVLPSNVTFTKSVLSTISLNRTLFVRLTAVLFVALFITIGFTQQAAYAELSAAVRDTSGQLVGIGVLFLSTISGSLASTQSEAQQLYVGAIYLLAWLVLVWLLRHILSKNVVTLRDGLYSAAAPVIPTLLVGIVAVLQLLPLAMIAAVVSALSSSGVISGWLLIAGFFVLFATATLTLYWLISTLFAAVIVTIPGTYPLAALRSARQLVRGYRGIILRRLLWAGFFMLVSYVVLVLPVIALDSLLAYPFALIVVAWSSLVGALAFIFGTSYLYLLYREVIDGRTE